ncbi:putative mitochondrial import inner membrane translocase subunit TIM21-like isoform X1 [Carex littledalei]|uniref:Mitochondrial import inner membrane translocase subunit Tim21 n=1 Tax=Carex littledalei TaxID=544730 RepID=A0A833VKS8_9POAL|nr:putative mitochondrial import inner membrane translocase subunit TIM21-like isoform X1 [Carex littledalei]
MTYRITGAVRNRLTQRLLVSAAASVSPARREVTAVFKDITRFEGTSSLLGNQIRWYLTKPRSYNNYLSKDQQWRHHKLPSMVRPCAADYSTEAPDKKPNKEQSDISTVEDPFDAPTYHIPEKPVTFTEGASYSLIILAGLGVAGIAAYGVFKELIFEPKEYKIFGKALTRVQNDSQVTVRIGTPVTGYGQESRNRAARQRIPNRVWTDEDGVEHVEVNFYIRGPHGAGKVYAEMFKDQSNKNWKFTYLIVEILSPSKVQLMLESYVPA